MRAREGDLIETDNGVVFDVKGLVHPPGKIIAFPRFIPSLEGARKLKNSPYGKVYSLPDRFSYLQQNAPDLIVHDPVFDETLCEVPKTKIKIRYQPSQKLKELRSFSHLGELETKALQLAVSLKNAANIPWKSIGISGSILVGLQTSKSDIDPVVYGVENCRKAYSALQQLLRDDTSHFKPYNREELRVLFDFRSKDTMMSFEDFAKVESRKAFQGKFMETDYFIRFVKERSETTETYGSVRYKNSGYARIKGTIADASEGLFTPCTYRVENVEIAEGPRLKPICEVVSFRGRFCEQAKNGEAVTAQGKMEKVIDTRKKKEYFRIIIGNIPSDYMVLSEA
jgi:predicted nucleotidyltransferase